MEEKPKEMLKEKKGITLIALVITIIVLLILAGVSIATLTGENGILHQAQRAKEETDIATVEEQRYLAMAEAAMNLENTEYKGVPIPAGFAPTRIDGENTVEEGLVIIDAEGNEFVWIPCEKEQVNNYVKANTLSTSESWSNNDYTTKGEWKNPDEQLNAGKASIENYGGFYVARYEAGVPTNADFFVGKNSEDKTYAEEHVEASNAEEVRKELGEKRNVVANEAGVLLKPVSKKGNQVWNFVDQKNAVTLSKNMYKNTSSVNSYLIDSNAWNYICEYVLKNKVTLTNSLKYGNCLDNNTTNYEGIVGLFAKHIHNGGWEYATKYEYGNVPTGYAPRGEDTNTNKLELATGICDDFKLYNIYDMAGNMWEWTAETASQDYAVLRGGSLINSGLTYPIVHSNGKNNVSIYNVNIGFRCVLYLK